jgi:AcrR family transcriptional regulator
MQDSSPTKGGRTRQAIMEAAYELFLQQGYAATSMRQVAERAGLALGGIYNHFPSKEAIFSELIVDRHPYKQIVPVLANTPANDVESFVRTAAHTLIDELGKRPDFIKLMFIETVEFHGRNMPRMLDEVLPQVLPLIDKFNKNKRVLRKMSPFTFFRIFLGMFFSYYMTEMLLSNTPAMLLQGNALDDFIEVFLHGIMVEEKVQSGQEITVPRNTGKSTKDKE